MVHSFREWATYIKLLLLINIMGETNYLCKLGKLICRIIPVKFGVMNPRLNHVKACHWLSVIVYIVIVTITTSFIIKVHWLFTFTQFTEIRCTGTFILLGLTKKSVCFRLPDRPYFLLADPIFFYFFFIGLPLLVEKRLYPFWGHSSFRVIHWETIVTKVHSQTLMAMKSGSKIYTQIVT